MPGLLIIIMWTASGLFGEEAVQGQISEQLQEYLGSGGAQSVERIIANARLTQDSLWMKTLGIGTLIFGATTLFLQLQKSLNVIWGVKSAPNNNIVKLLADRATSLGLILAIAFLLLVSLILSALLSVVSGWIQTYFGETLLIVIRLFNVALSLGVTSLLFAIMFKALPDVEIGWRSVWAGALTAGVLFTVGKTLLGVYFGYSEPESTFGAAGTIILVMLWVNYTCLILFFGANFAQVYAVHHGHPILPSSHAKWISVKPERASS
jgi:membrane protein